VWRGIELPCIKLFVKGLPGILSFITGHYQISCTFLIANRYVYWDLFAEDSYAKDKGFNVFHLDMHVVELGYANFSLSWVINFWHNLPGKLRYISVCWQMEL
jgi:hypothetical protein